VICTLFIETKNAKKFDVSSGCTFLVMDGENMTFESDVFGRITLSGIGYQVILGHFQILFIKDHILVNYET
jgi:hypothetical protein